MDSDFALCGACWRDTHFVGGTICDGCGVPLPGEPGNGDLYCDDCMSTARPWGKGRAALVYKDTARKMVLALKHGDRPEIARGAAFWMKTAGRDVLRPGMLIVPVPLHRTRLLKRRYNQSALLAQALARETGIEWCPDALLRLKATASLDGLGKDQRFAMMQNSIIAHPKRRHLIRGRMVLLIDDVMTSGATFAAATEACNLAGASEVFVLALARVAKDA